MKKQILKDNLKHFESYPKVVVKKSFAGLGLFAGENIKKGKYIIQYIGEKITNKQAAEKPNRYIFDLNKRFSLDGSSRANTARYINHLCKVYNSDSCDDNGKIFFEANRDILEGEEITTDYGEEYFKEYIMPRGCKCHFCKRDDKVDSKTKDLKQ
jgi:SET domain-containing protein